MGGKHALLDTFVDLSRIACSAAVPTAGAQPGGGGHHLPALLCRPGVPPQPGHGGRSPPASLQEAGPSPPPVYVPPLELCLIKRITEDAALDRTG